MNTFKGKSVRSQNPKNNGQKTFLITGKVTASVSIRGCNVIGTRPPGYESVF